MSVKIKKEAEGMLNPSDTIVRDRGYNRARTGVYTVGAQPGRREEKSQKLVGLAKGDIQ